MRDIPLPPDVLSITAASRKRRARRIMIGALVGTLILCAGATAAHALFSAQATVTGQQISTGTIAITANATAPISITDMLPGDMISTEVTVENTGTEQAYLSLTLPAVPGANASLLDQLSTTVFVTGVAQGAGDTQVVQSLGDWQTGALKLKDPLEPNDTRTFEVTIELPLGAPNALQGSMGSFDITVDAVQVRNTPAPTADQFVTD